jgi:hypothetical protein
MVAIARKLLVAVWHVLTKHSADRHAEPERVARKFPQHAYRLGRTRRTPGQPTCTYVRRQLDQLALGRDLRLIHRGQRKISVPPATSDATTAPTPAT